MFNVNNARWSSKVSAIGAKTITEIREIPNTSDELLVVLNDQVPLLGWPAQVPVANLGRGRAAVATTVFRHLEGRFETQFLNVVDEQNGRGIRAKWFEPVDVSFRVYGYRLEHALTDLQRCNRESELASLQELEENAPLGVPLLIPLMINRSGLPTPTPEESLVNHINLKLLNQMKLSATIIYRDLQRWYQDCGVTLLSSRFEFGVTGKELILTGNPGGLDDSMIAVNPDDEHQYLGPVIFEQWIATARDGNRNAQSGRLEAIGERIFDAHRSLYERLSGQSFDTWLGESSLYQGQRTRSKIFRRR